MRVHFQTAHQLIILFCTLAETMEFKIIHLPVIDSTNQHALRLINSGAEDGNFIVWADEQNKGRGHHDNSWISEAGKNLTVSLVIQPAHILPSQQFILTQTVSLALRNLISNFVQDNNIKIKWPNDLYVGDKKLAGILIQNILKGNVLEYSVIGVGLNLNQVNFPEELSNPVSLKQITGADYNIEKLLSELTTEFSEQYHKTFSTVECPGLRHEYLVNMYRYKQRVKFREGKSVFYAVVDGIGEYGRLQLKLDDGSTGLFEFKDVEFLI